MGARFRAERSIDRRVLQLSSVAFVSLLPAERGETKHWNSRVKKVGSTGERGRMTIKNDRGRVRGRSTRTHSRYPGTTLKTCARVPAPRKPRGLRKISGSGAKRVWTIIFGVLL